MIRLLAGAFVCLLLVACTGDEPGAPPTSQPAQAVTPEPRTTPTISAEPIGDPPDAEIVLRDGDDVPYRVCSHTTGWQRPRMDEMQRVFTDTRLGDGTLPFPAGYVYYLENAYYVQYPTANSANRDWNAFSGFWTETGETERLCDPPDTAALVRQYGAPAKSDAPWYQDLLLVDHHVVEMRRIDADLVVRVESAPATHEYIYFPYPAGPAFFTSALGFDSVQVVDDSGSSIHVEVRFPSREWYERIQYAADGQLDTIALGGRESIASTGLAVPSGQGTMTLYAGYGPPWHTIPQGQIVALDAAGQEILRLSWPASPALWQPLATIDLPPQTDRIRIETEDAAADGSLWSFVLIRNGLPLPPGADAAH